MSAPTREEFAQLVGTYEAQAYDHGYCEGCASYDDEGLSGAKRTAGRAESRVKATGAALLAAFDALAAERDEWKRRAEEEGGLARKAESLAARKLVEYAALDIEMDEIAVALGYAEEHEGNVMRAPHPTLLRVIREYVRAGRP